MYGRFEWARYHQWFRLNYFDMPCICCVYTIHILTNLFCQGHDSAPGLEIMLQKQQHLSVSGQAANQARQHPPVEYVFPCFTSEGLTTSLAKSLSFHAFWMEMQPQLSHISTAADSGTLLSTAVLMVQALPRGGAAMFTRSTPGCGILDAPSLAWAASQWPRLRRSEGSPSQRLQSADGQPSGLASDLRTAHSTVYVWYIYGIYLVYPWYILSNSKSCLLSAIK
jgi:hypothetical protein